jgi:hypothetical protein
MPPILPPGRVLTEPDPYSTADIMYQLRYQEVSATDVTGYIAWVRWPASWAL